jgi:hypothetical protein
MPATERFCESRCHDTFMQSEGVSTHRGIGVRPVTTFAERPGGAGHGILKVRGPAG